MTLSDEERKILEYLFQARVWKSTLNISKKVGYAWETTQEILKDLKRNKYVYYLSSGNRHMWKFNYQEWDRLRRKKKN